MLTKLLDLVWTLKIWLGASRSCSESQTFSCKNSHRKKNENTSKYFAQRYSRILNPLVCRTAAWIYCTIVYVLKEQNICLYEHRPHDYNPFNFGSRIPRYSEYCLSEGYAIQNTEYLNFHIHIKYWWFMMASIGFGTRTQSYLQLERLGFPFFFFQIRHTFVWCT
jgi:hypothetical protein